MPELKFVDGVQVGKFETFVAKVYKEISGRQLPMIGVTERGVAALESGDLGSLPTIDG
jgi:hypothetical protein